MAVRQTEYISWPGPQEGPGEDFLPYVNRTARDTTVVHGRHGWEWTEDTSDATQKVKMAVDAAKGIQRFINITTDQLTVTGTAFITEAVIQKIWTRIITAEEGVFGKIKAGMIEAHEVTADKVKAGAIDGMQITGAIFQTKPYGQYPRTVISSDGMYVWDQNNNNTLSINKNGSIWIDGELGISDSWSWARFIDLKADDTGKDVGGNGRKVGVGIEFQRANSPYSASGNITIAEDAAGVPRLDLQAPRRGVGGAPRIRLSEEEIMLLNSTSHLSIDSRGFFGKAAGGKAFGCEWEEFYIRAGKYESSTFGVKGTKDGLWLSWDYDCDHRFYTSGVEGQVSCMYSHGAFVLVRQKPNDAGKYIQLSKDTWVYGSLGANNKTFIIEHPLAPYDKSLIHSCTESPWPGVEYWGTVTVGEDGSVEVVLPDYFNALHRPDLPLAVLCSGPGSPWASKVRLGRFTVHGEPGSTVSWLVKAVRRAEHTRTLGPGEPPVEGPPVSAPVAGGDEEAAPEPKDLRWLYEPPVPTE